MDWSTRETYERKWNSNTDEGINQELRVRTFTLSPTESSRNQSVSKRKY